VLNNPKAVNTDK